MATPRIAGAALASRRQTILAAAARRFAERGFETTTVRQIADDVDILSGSLYHHFATKEDMLHDILRNPSTACASAPSASPRCPPTPKPAWSP